MDRRLRDGRVRVDADGLNRFQPLTIGARRMWLLGDFAVAQVKGRAAQALGPYDTPAKPLAKGYAIRKTRAGKGNRRTLSFLGKVGGHMLDNLRVRTVGENSVRASFSTKAARDKAVGNSRIEPFLVFSPGNTRKITERANELLLGNNIKGLFGPAS